MRRARVLRRERQLVLWPLLQLAEPLEGEKVQFRAPWNRPRVADQDVARKGREQCLSR